MDAGEDEAELGQREQCGFAIHRLLCVLLAVPVIEKTEAKL